MAEFQPSSTSPHLRTFDEGVVIDVESDDHELLEGHFDGPDFPAHLAVDLDANLRGDGH